MTVYKEIVKALDAFAKLTDSSYEFNLIPNDRENLNPYFIELINHLKQEENARAKSID